MATGDILGTGISGLLAFQRHLATTGHNISNVNTEGYTRQRVELAARIPQPAGNGFIGTGVSVTTVQRVYDEFLANQVRSSTTAYRQSDVFHTLAAELDDLLADPRAGLAPSLESFFSAVQDVANSPASLPIRQVLLSEANSLTQQFQALDQRLDDLRTRTNQQLRNVVSEINSLAGSIAQLNDDIVVATGAAGGQPPNDLLDQRDELVRKLSERIGVSTVTQDDGSMNVFIGNGQTLVLGKLSFSLAVVPNPYDASRPEVAFVNGATSNIVTDSLSGGDVGGLLAFRRDVLDQAQNTLGRVAIALTDTFNAQHALGQDLNGALGTDFFGTGILAGNAAARASNTGTAAIDYTVTDVSALTTSDYLLSFSGGAWTLTRQSDGVQTAIAGFPATVDGFTFDLTAGAAANGDAFLIRPTVGGAGGVSVALGDPARVAAAGPVRAGAATDVNGLALNTGNGRIGAVSVANVTGVPLATTYTLTFSTALNQFTVVPAGGPLAYSPATESGGKTFTITDAAFGDITFTLSGVPADGDAFTIERNTGGTGDNRNMLALGQLQDRAIIDNGTADYQAAYGRLVADVGIRTRSAEITRDANQTLMNRAIESHQSVSGVNLDEEAANLVRFQQAYQAAAQIIASADLVFQTLLGAIRR